MTSPPSGSPSAPLSLPRPVTLIYAVRGDGRVLLLKRRRWPYIGHWVAPGGKLEPGESPHAGALRELREETALDVAAGALELRALVSETAPRADWQWLIFVYRVRLTAAQAGGALTGEQPEGELRWVAPAALAALAIPEGDRRFTPWVLGDAPGVKEFSLRYDGELTLCETVAHGPGNGPPDGADGS